MVSQFLRQQVVEFCATISADSLLVQGAGGNISWKDNGLLWVKASGMWIGDAVEKDIFVPVNLMQIREALVRGDFSFLPTPINDSQLRPSIETLLHAIMPHRIVVHLHAVNILACLVRKNCEHEIAERMVGCGHHVIVDYFKPGAELAAAVMTALSNYGRANVVFMKNHGVVIGGDSVDDVVHTLKSLLLRFEADPVINMDLQDSYSSDPEPHFEGYCRLGNCAVQWLAINPYLYGRLAEDWVLYPDHVVFMGAAAIKFDSEAEFFDYIETYSRPDFFFLKGLGVWYLETEFSQAKFEQLRCYYDVLVRQLPSVELASLKAAQVGELLNWDAEQYRIELAK